MTIGSWWRERVPREKIALGTGIAALLLLSLFLVLAPMVEEKRRLSGDIPRLRQELAWMQAHLGELRSLQARSSLEEARPVSPAMLEKALRQARLQDQVSELRPDGAGQVEMKFEQVPYRDLVHLLHRLRRESGAVVSTAMIRESEGNAGMVEAGLTFTSVKRGNRLYSGRPEPD